MKRYREQERILITEFIKHRNVIANAKYPIPTQWIEDHNDSTSEVECVIVDSHTGEKLALEHTIVPSFVDQPKANEDFERYIRPHEQIVKDAFPDFGFFVSFPVFHSRRALTGKRSCDLSITGS